MTTRFEKLSAVVGERVLTAEEAAAVLCLSRQSVAAMLRDGKLSGRRIGKSWAVPESAIKNLLAVGDDTN